MIVDDEIDNGDVCEYCGGDGKCSICDYSHIKDMHLVCRCPGICIPCGGTGKTPKQSPSEDNETS